MWRLDRKLGSFLGMGLRNASRAAVELAGRTELTPLQPANLLLPCFSRRSRAGLCLLGPAALDAQEHRAALVDFHCLPVGGQSDYTKRLGASGLEDCEVVKPVRAAGIH